MARGWESKAVESQLEENDSRRYERGEAFETSPAVRARRQELDSLRLSRARTLEQLEQATGSIHREMLKRTLIALEKKIADLS